MEEKLNLSNDGIIWSLNSVQEAFQRVYDHYRSLYNRNKYLEEENKRLKSEAYKDEELSKMKDSYKQMKWELQQGFPISDEEMKNIKQWIEKIEDKTLELNIGTLSCGGRYHYEFYPTSIGTCGVIVDDLTKARFEFKEIS